MPLAIPSAWQGWVDDWNILAPIVKKNFLGLSVIPANDLVYAGPFFQPAEAVLFILGMAILIWNWRRPASFLLTVWIASTVLGGGTLLNVAAIPNFAHWTPAFPAFFVAMSVPLALFISSLRTGSRRLWQAGRVALALWLAWSAVTNIYYYLVIYPPTVPANQSDRAVQGRYLATLGPDVMVRFIGNSAQVLFRDGSQLLAPDTPFSQNIQPQPPVAFDTGPETRPGVRLLPRRNGIRATD